MTVEIVTPDEEESMADEQTKVEQMEAANVLDASEMSEEHRAVINGMTQDEINALIKAKQMISPDHPWRPNYQGISF